jgi:hypothetical protein
VVVNARRRNRPGSGFAPFSHHQRNAPTAWALSSNDRIVKRAGPSLTSHKSLSARAMLISLVCIALSKLILCIPLRDLRLRMFRTITAMIATAGAA